MTQKRDSLFLAIVVLAAGYGAYKMAGSEVTTPIVEDHSDNVDLANQGILVTPKGASVKTLPDFKNYSDVKQKKAKFFAFLLPLIEQENNRIAADRQRLLAVYQSFQDNTLLNDEQYQWLHQLASYYRIDPKNQTDKQLLKTLINRVDIVPASLALSQSANESAWGTSRFATKGNNLFGQWCFRKGCGLVPKQRPEGANYEVAAFDTPAESVASYIRNLNTHSAYLYFRELRSKLRNEQQSLSGKYLAQGLESYSTRGEHYIDELQAMIRVNKLERFDVEQSLSSEG